jgi:type IV pilus assembly protein PilB
MKKLGQILVESKLIDEIQLEAALAYQKKYGGRLGNAVAELNFAHEFEIARAISQHIKIPYVNIFTEDFSDEEMKKVDESLIRKYDFIPLRKVGHALQIAMSDPTDLDVIADIQFALGCTVKPMLALESEIKAFIRQYYSGTLAARKSVQKNAATEFELIRQDGIWEGKSQDRTQKVIKALILTLVEKGLLTSEEAVNILG